MEPSPVPTAEHPTDARDRAPTPDTQSSEAKASVWVGAPFWTIQLLAVAGLFVFAWTWEALALVAVTYFLRMFGITAGFHRYFAHRGFKTSRVFQFVLAVLGTATAQKGVLWWSGHHVDHHRYSDTDRDIHSPKKGFYWSHVGWLLVPTFEATPEKQIRAFSAYPEIIWLSRNWLVPPVAMAVGLFLAGGWSWLYWGFFFSTFLTWHGTFTINSLAHVWGPRRYRTTDTSRNNFVLSLITLGEGWHNNHHHYPSTANNGFFWWEIDITYAVLRILEKFGVVWDLRTPPRWVLEGRARRDDPEFSALVRSPAASSTPPRSAQAKPPLAPSAPARPQQA